MARNTNSRRDERRERQERERQQEVRATSARAAAPLAQPAMTEIRIISTKSTKPRGSSLPGTVADVSSRSARMANPVVISARPVPDQERAYRPLDRAPFYSRMREGPRVSERLPGKVSAQLAVDTAAGRVPGETRERLDQAKGKGLSLEQRAESACKAANRPLSNKGNGSSRPWVDWCKTGRSGKR